VVLPPFIAAVGEPYYRLFEIPVLQLDEIVSEKLRTLIQRSRSTDLAPDAPAYEEAKKLVLARLPHLLP
jgi:hypothetical protein